MTTIDEQIDQYFSLGRAIHEAFGYRENWCVIPLDDRRSEHWMLVGGDDGTCVWSPDPLTIASVKDGKTIYSGSIYTQRFLKKWVYRTTAHVLVSVDTMTDGNKFLMIFDADKECTDEAVHEAWEKRWG